MAQTRDGYLWIGTEEGLARFDGLRFTVYDAKTPGLRNKTVTALLSGNQNSLWIGTNGGGLSRFRDGVFTAFTTHEGLPSNSILCLYQSRAGTLWIGTDGGGLAAFREGKFVVYTKANGLSDNVIFSLSESKDGTIWIATRHGLDSFSGGRFAPANSDLLGSSEVRATLVDRSGALWAGTAAAGLFRVSSGAVTRFSTHDGLTSDSILSLFEDASGSLWIGTAGGGLNRYANGKFGSSTEKDGLLGSDVESILEGSDGSLWVGTAGGGLNCFREGTFTTLSKTDGLTSDTILSILEDRSGGLWIASDHGLMLWKDGRVAAYSEREGLPDSLVFSIAQDLNGNIWAGTKHGFSRLQNGRFTTFTTKDGLPNDFVASSFVDRQGSIWIGTRGGLTRYDGKQFITYTARDGLSNNFVRSIAQDKTGDLWIGTEGGGVDRLKDGRFTAYTTREGLSNDVVRAVYADSDGTIWLATNGGGLNRLRNGHLTSYTVDSGFYDGDVFSILDDASGHLWFTSNRGVFSISKRQLNDFAEGRTQRVTPTVYSITDGLKSRECNGGFQPAAWRLKDGRLAFPTMSGLALTNPAQLQRKKNPVSAVIENVIADLTDFPAGRPVIVPPGRGQLEIQFTAPVFTNPEFVQFSYMLEGFDKDWTEAGTRRAAYYTNLPHGQYRFRVRISGGDSRGGNWSDPGSMLPITLKPHYYQTLAFFVLLGILSVGVCAATYGWRMKQLGVRERTLLAIVNEKTSALRESERQVRRSRDELDLRVQERTIELVRANQALETDLFIWRQAERQLTAAKEEAEASRRTAAEVLANVGVQLSTPITEIRELTKARLQAEPSRDEREYLETVLSSAGFLLSLSQGISASSDSISNPQAR
jgi:ligand-binding sensor domain-containing protein